MEMIPDNTDPWRPATVFLSYKRENTEEVKYLQQQLKVRGIRAWRDVTNMPLGSSTEEEITRAIWQESDAFVIYITPQCLTSDFIWNIEVLNALRRRKDDPSFNIIPILRGVTVVEVQQVCANHDYRSLTDFNGVNLPGRNTGKNRRAFFQALREVARRTLEATLDLRLRRIGADRSYEPWLCFKTFPYEPPATSLDLDLDLRELFDHRLPTDEEWQEMLLPALKDVNASLSIKTSSGKVHLFIKAVLPAAFALGYMFPATSPFTLFFEGDHGTWSTRGAISEPSPLRCLSHTENGDASTAIVEIAIARDTEQDVTRSLPALGISFGYHIRFDLEDGPDDVDGVRDAAHALAMAHQIRKELKRLCDNQGILHLHLFAAVPAPLAVMIGHQFNALGKITLYHHIKEKRNYIPACTLGIS